VDSSRLQDLNRRDVITKINSYRLSLLQEAPGTCGITEHVLHIGGHRQRFRELRQLLRIAGDSNSTGQPWPGSHRIGL